MFLINSMQRICIGLHLNAVMLCQIRERFLRHIVRLKVDDRNTVIFDHSAVYDALQQHLLAGKALTVAAAIIEDGELKLTDIWCTAAELATNFCFNKLLNVGGVWFWL